MRTRKRSFRVFPYGNSTRSYVSSTRPVDPSSVDHERLYFQEVEALKPGTDDWATGLCPFHDDRHPSFSVNLRTGAFFCHTPSCGARGGNAISFLMQRYALGASAARALLEGL